MQPQKLIFDIPSVTLPNQERPIPAHRVACHEWGNPDADYTVLCVHGLTRNSRDFDFLARSLSSRYRVLCPDMPGRGSSQWLTDPTTYAYPTYINDILFIIHTLKITKIHWVGTSMGGIIGMMMAGLAPGILQSMILNDIGCLIPKAGLMRIFEYVGVKTYFANRVAAEAALRDIFQPFGITKEEHWQHFFTHSLQEKDGGFALAYDPAIAMNFPKKEEVQDIDLWPFWESLMPLPCLLIRGEKSDLLTRDTALSMMEKHPHLTLHEVPNTGHAPTLMDEREIGLISNWLAG